jgi:lipopolysaccharide transport system permease protein
MGHSNSVSRTGDGDAQDNALMEMLRELWDYRELFYFFAWRDVKLRYKQTAFGVLWVIIQPLFTMVIFTFLFGRVANIPSDGAPRPVFYFCALVPWIYLSSTVGNVSMSLISNADLLTKIYFPRIILPGATALSGIVDFAVASVFLVGFIEYYAIPIGFNLLLWPAFLVPLVLLALSVGMILAALNVKYRDIKYAVPFGIQLWLFVTPIIYPTSMVPAQYQWLLALNPLSGIIEGFRYSLVPGMAVHWDLVGISLIETVVLFVVAVAFFGRSEKAFADFV